MAVTTTESVKPVKTVALAQTVMGPVEVVLHGVKQAILVRLGNGVDMTHAATSRVGANPQPANPQRVLMGSANGCNAEARYVARDIQAQIVLVTASPPAKGFLTSIKPQSLNPVGKLISQELLKTAHRAAKVGVGPQEERPPLNSGNSQTGYPKTSQAKEL